MADFNPAFDTMIRNEGGYINHCVSGDKGGQTYAGISRKFHPYWSGWAILDKNDMNNAKLTEMVYTFYQQAFWQKMKGDEIHNQQIATSIFDFSVNSGIKTAVKLAQVVVSTTPDGILGQQTLCHLNHAEEELFVNKYALAKVARYREIVKKDKSQEKFLLGWLNRALAVVL
ncbi:glycoside hydrolase family 108 protein [Zooshikella ganghwensis]|uniref:glycoside hydrolase family 108 protein n=1 Tax=Zooshikella ganghwensis TaxID=202772 RepID=UPI0004220CCC|nr:glycosyl hydrolase 108 family protein [Zooshikella ganghwensis]